MSTIRSPYGAYADGAPFGAAGGRVGDPANPFGVDLVYDRDRRRPAAGRPARPAPLPLLFEGLRGGATRSAVYARYVAAYLTVLACSAAVHGLLAGSRWETGGRWMMLSAALMIVTGAFGTMVYTNQRNEIVEQVRHFVFGLSVFPGVGLAVLMRASDGFFASPGAQGDAFASVMGNALPILYFITVLVPPLVFIKTIAGLRNLHRSNLDNEEYMRLYTRQDDLLR